MSAYLSRRGLEAVREGLSERDLAILRSVSEHRFLTASQIEALHFADHATNGSGARVCRRVLARLTKQRLVARPERRVGGVRAGSASFVYALAPVGSRLLDGTRQRFTEPSAHFLDHTLAVAEVHVELVRASRQQRVELVSVQVEPACWRRYQGAGGALEIVKPDLYVVTGAGEFEDCWFVEIDRATESPAAISRKLQAYHAYWASGREQDKYGAFPLVVWVAPSERRASQLERVIATARQLNGQLFGVTTADRLVGLLSQGAAA